MDDHELDKLAWRALCDRGAFCDRGGESAFPPEARLESAMRDRRLEERFARPPKAAARPAGGESRGRAAAGFALPIVASAMLVCGALLDRGPQREARRFAQLWPREYDAALTEYMEAAQTAFDLQYGGK
jgi:hypothetical protein